MTPASMVSGPSARTASARAECLARTSWSSETRWFTAPSLRGRGETGARGQGATAGSGRERRWTALESQSEDAARRSGEHDPRAGDIRRGAADEPARDRGLGELLVLGKPALHRAPDERAEYGENGERRQGRRVQPGREQRPAAGGDAFGVGLNEVDDRGDRKERERQARRERDPQARPAR